jgi:LacI family gluconate utilization system Gnt-I transcriptional repressor
MAQLLDSGQGTLGVFCSSDVVAHGALAEANARGCSIPDQLAVIGFGDFDFAPYTHPPLTTIRIDRRDIGTKAARSILKKIEGDGNVEAMINIDFHIVARGTA